MKPSVTETREVASDHFLQHQRSGHSEKIGASGRHRQGKTEPEQVVCEIPDHGLIQVAYLDINVSLHIGDRSDVAMKDWTMVKVLGSE